MKAKYKFVLSKGKRMAIEYIMAFIIYWSFAILPFEIYLHYYDVLNVNLVSNEISPMEIYPLLSIFMTIIILILCVMIFESSVKFSRWIVNKFDFNIAKEKKLSLTTKQFDLLKKINDMNLKYDDMYKRCNFCGEQDNQSGVVVLHSIIELESSGCEKCYAEISRQFLAELKEYPELYE